MEVKIRATIDLDIADDNMGEHGSLERGVYGCDEEGAYYMWYGSRTNLVSFEDVEIIQDNE